MAPALSTIRASQIPTIHLGIDYGHSCIRVFQQKVEDGGEPTVGNAELVLLQNGQEQAEQLLSFTRRIIDGKEKFYCTYGADAQHEWDVRRDVEANAGPRVFLRSLKECFFETKDSEQCRQENARALREGFGKSISLEWVVKEHLDVVHRDVMAQLLRRYGKTYGVREVADWALVTTVTVPEPKANDSSSPEVSPFHGAVKKSKFAAGRNTFKFISEADSSAAFGFHRRPEQDGGHVHRFRLVTDLGGSTLDTCLSKLADEALQGVETCQEKVTSSSEPWGFDILFFRKLIKIIKRRLAKKAKLPIADLAARLGMSVQEFNIDLRERLDTYKDEWRMSDKWQRHFFVTSIPNGDYDIYVDVYRSEVERLKDEMGDMIIGEILRICDSIELPQGEVIAATMTGQGYKCPRLRKRILNAECLRDRVQFEIDSGDDRLRLQHAVAKAAAARGFFATTVPGPCATMLVAVDEPLDRQRHGRRFRGEKRTEIRDGEEVVLARDRILTLPPPGDSVDQCWSFWILVDAPRDIKFIDHQIYYTRNKSVKDGQWLYRKVNKGPAKKLRQGISRRGDPGIIRLPGLERTSYLHEGQEKHKPCLLDWSEEKEDGTLRFMYRVDIVSSGVDQTAHYTLMEPGFIPPEQPLIRKGTTERPSGGFYLDADRLQWEGAIAQLQRVPAKPTNVTPPPKTSPSPTSSKTVPSQNAVVPTSTRSTSTTNRDERSTSLITQSSVEEKSTSTPPTANSQSASVSPGDVSPTTRRLFFRPKGGPGEVK